jgi:hypothetical protein
MNNYDETSPLSPHKGMRISEMLVLFESMRALS